MLSAFSQHHQTSLPPCAEGTLRPEGVKPEPSCLARCLSVLGTVHSSLASPPMRGGHQASRASSSRECVGFLVGWLFNGQSGPPRQESVSD